MTGSDHSFRCEVENLTNDAVVNKVTTVKCHGRLTADNSEKLKLAVAPLITQGGKIVIDLGDVNFVGSSGLGALIALKISALKQGMCTLQVANIGPRIMEVMRFGNLSEFLSS